ncbi:hypothetical protein bcgnr5390_12740 [Bacillus luti]|nr:hypothetical protein BC2903_51420 [Bacillus cereus]
MKTNVFLHKENEFAFSFNKSDIKSLADKNAICKLIRTMFLTVCIHCDFESTDLDEVLSEIDFNHVAFIIKNQDLAYFAPTD